MGLDTNIYKMSGGVLVPVEQYGYNAATDKGRRQAPQSRPKHESLILTQTKRAKLQGTAQDQVRNHSLVAWMVRKHLDYVSRFKPSINSKYEEINILLNRVFKWHGRPENFDFLGKLGREESFRLFEMEKVVSGDAGFIKLPGYKMFAVESDMISKGANAPVSVDKEGLITDKWGRVTKYAICRRDPQSGRPIHDHLEKRENVIFDGYWSRFSSQNRGVSPLSTAINTVQDLSEAFEFNLLKAKMQAIFGLALERQGLDGEFGEASGSTAANLNINPSSINILDLGIGEKLNVIESKTPSTEFVNASYLYVHLAMLALDVPITCFDSRRSSFSARIADLNEYEVSTSSKRDKNRYVRQDYSDWLIKSIWFNSNDAFELRKTAEKYKLRLRDVQELVEWIGAGSPWLDKLKQVRGDELSISLGLDNPIDAARRRGGDVFENIDKIAKVQDYAKSKGVTITSGAGVSIESELLNAIENVMEEREADKNNND